MTAGRIKKIESTDSISDYCCDSLFDLETLDDVLRLIRNARKHGENEDVKALYAIRLQIKAINTMVGLSDLKKRLLYQILFFCQNLQGDEMMHTVLMGPPGVGKTTVAKLIGLIYTKLGFLSKGTFTAVGRDQLIGQYLGETSIKTEKVLKSCIGGVLFIDEAYSLGNGGESDSYSKECIDTINKFLSEHTKDFVCIIAGYPEQLNTCFFEKNPGLDRRFPWKYNLEPYKTNELNKIFELQLLRGKWKFRKPRYAIAVENIINHNKELFKNNGGDTENFVNMCKMAHGKRVFGQRKTWKRFLVRNDIVKGFEMYKSNKEKKSDPSISNFMMYT